MSFDLVFSGPPSGNPTAAGATSFGVDTQNFNGYLTTSSGWIPFAPSTVAKAVQKGLTANNTNILTYAVTISGLYKVDLYEVSTTAPTAATLPAITVVFTEADTAGSITDTLASVGSVAAANVVNQGGFVINAQSGSNVVVATASYNAGSGTALAYNIKARITYLG